MPDATHGGAQKLRVTLLRGSDAEHEKRETVQKSREF
jgi:hypothetical protein